ncbi:MAG: UbiA family prenyltransferase [Chloroflexi bacterium]|nr:UbiA family prenyltransferase [Chloroflexota bacterium]
MTTPNQTVKSPASMGARALWYLECWGLKRIDAWGVSYIAGALALVVHHALSLQTFILLIAITANYWLGYWLNDYFDAAHDGQDERKARQNLFVQRPAVRRWVWLVSGLTFGLSAASFISFGWQGVMVLSLNFAVMWAYSAPPLRLKNKPGLDLLSHAFFVQTWPYIICMWLAHANWMQLDGILLAIFFFTSLNGQLNQQVRDFDVDARTDMNFTTWAGLEKSILILKVSAWVVVLFGVVVVISASVPWLLVPLGFLGLPKIVYQMSHRAGNSNRTFPREIVYATMLLALLYMGVLMTLKSIV